MWSVVGGNGIVVVDAVGGVFCIDSDHGVVFEGYTTLSLLCLLIIIIIFVYR